MKQSVCQALLLFLFHELALDAGRSYSNKSLLLGRNSGCSGKNCLLVLLLSVRLC